jgi:hypothetical protein
MSVAPIHLLKQLPPHVASHGRKKGGISGTAGDHRRCSAFYGDRGGEVWRVHAMRRFGLPLPPYYYYYSPSPPASYPCSSGNCPTSPGEYIRIGSTPPGKGLLYPQDPGFMPSSASRRTVPIAAFWRARGPSSCDRYQSFLLQHSDL